MPNIKSAKKRVELTKIQNAANRRDRSALRTVLKKYNTELESGTPESREAAFKTAVRALDKAAAHNLIHKNNAANKKSQLAKRLAKVS
jgi:small subunit ribosomal protein S20